MKKILFVTMCCLISAVTFSHTAYADRSAVVFIEVTHEDSPIAAEFELAMVHIILYEEDGNFFNSYDKFYWLVNTSTTREDFLGTVIKAVDQSETVDVYIIAHGGTQYFWGHYDNRLTIDEILGLGAVENMGHLRFVYILACHSYDLTDEFVDIGANSSSGEIYYASEGVMLPVFIKNFRIESGKTAGESIELANQASGMHFKVNGDPTITMTSPSSDE